MEQPGAPEPHLARVDGAAVNGEIGGGRHDTNTTSLMVKRSDTPRPDRHLKNHGREVKVVGVVEV